MTVGVPVSVQPGIVTELYPDRDGSPNSAPGFTNRFGLVTRLVKAAGCTPAGPVTPNNVSNSLRANANSVHNSGVCAGAPGLSLIDGPRPTNPSTVETTPVTMFSGANGPLNGAGLVCGVTSAVGVAAKETGDDCVDGVIAAKVLKVGLDVVVVKSGATGDCRVEAALSEFTCRAGDVETANDATFDEVLGAPPSGWTVDVLAALDNNGFVTVVDASGFV
jgi:hypothetical protein